MIFKYINIIIASHYNSNSKEFHDDYSEWYGCPRHVLFFNIVLVHRNQCGSLLLFKGTISVVNGFYLSFSHSKRLWNRPETITLSYEDKNKFILKVIVRVRQKKGIVVEMIIILSWGCTIFMFGASLFKRLSIYCYIKWLTPMKSVDCKHIIVIITW